MCKKVCRIAFLKKQNSRQINPPAVLLLHFRAHTRNSMLYASCLFHTFTASAARFLNMFRSVQNYGNNRQAAGYHNKKQAFIKHHVFHSPK